jgi:hypothetical protein
MKKLIFFVTLFTLTALAYSPPLHAQITKQVSALSVVTKDSVKNTDTTAIRAYVVGTSKSITAIAVKETGYCRGRFVLQGLLNDGSTWRGIDSSNYTQASGTYDKQFTLPTGLPYIDFRIRTISDTTQVTRLKVYRLDRSTP